MCARALAAFRTLARINKRKVRLAYGADQHNRLSQEAMQRGCSAPAPIFRTLAGYISPQAQTRVVATATLRLKHNTMPMNFWHRLSRFWACRFR
ncbi:MAG: Ppx/GppA phosphatase family protein [Candidatus Malihini olakiniferum]